MAPDKTGRQVIVALLRKQAGIRQRSLQGEAGSDLRRRPIQGDFPAANSEAAKPGPGRSRSKLLLEVEAHTALGVALNGGDEGLDSVHARAEAMKLVGVRPNSNR